MSHWLLIYDFAPDYLERRGAFRSEHLALGWTMADAGELILGGAVGDPPESGLILFNDRDAAERFAAGDPYVANGIVRSWRVAPWTTVIGENSATPIRE
ncbi:YciI-like protein [Sphingomonas sp. Y38-1Y]|uniref:YciI-like protein n=1 Tax=Sphingomonas sp. Y38-1Y TaxID=3078265 RepID=UPI0028F0EC05|nr:YciI-like protein [Sphingomonas sp. Y38-1Y]